MGRHFQNEEVDQVEITTSGSPFLRVFIWNITPNFIETLVGEDHRKYGVKKVGVGPRLSAFEANCYLFDSGHVINP